MADLQHSVSRSDPPTPSTSKPLNSCVTRVESLKLSQKWVVENFLSVVKLSKPGNCLRSQVFRHASFPDACWQLCLYPGGKREENANNVSLFLKMSATTPTKEVLLKAEYRFFFMDDKDNLPKFSNINIGDFHAKPPKGGHSWGLRNIPRQKLLNSLRDDGSLLILCEIEMIPDLTRARCLPEKPICLFPNEMVQIPERFIRAQRDLLATGNLSDWLVEVKPEGKVFPVHKCILAAQSEVLAAMFSHDEVTESSEGKLIIEDFPAASVKSFLVYIYTGCTDTVDLEERGDDLMGLAEKYRLPALKTICEDHLVGQVELSNVCQLIALADLYMAENLKKACIQYVCQRKADVMGSRGWAELKCRNSVLVNEVLEVMVKAADGGVQISPPPYKRCRQI